MADAKSLYRKAIHKRGGDAAGLTETVHKQLQEDFPDSAIEWVRSAKWDGPTEIPLSSVDFSNSAKWHAASNQDHVDEFKKAIKDDSVKPAILVNEPNNEKLVVVDGHHRAMAAKQSGSSIKAYVGTVGAVGGKWRDMHKSQRGRASG